MSSTIFYSDFKTLRQSYFEVKAFIENEAVGDVLSLKTKIEGDIGCSGDDNWDLLNKFVTKYKLEATGFDYSKHFLSEGELFGSGAVLETLLWTLFILPVARLVKLLTKGNIDWTKKQFFPDSGRETIDMTFGDMLTWYLTGKYNLGKDVVVRLQSAT